MRPGWKAGTKITFTEKGDEKPGIIPADIVFVVEEKPHARFRRDGNNLTHTARLTLADALCGTVLRLQTLDDRTIELPLAGVTPQSMKRVVGEGMPIAKTPGTRGDLYVKFEIEFPLTLRLGEEQKEALRALLGQPAPLATAPSK